MSPSRVIFRCALLCLSAGLLLILSCSSDENNLHPQYSQPNIINVRYENARVVEVDANRHLALLLHNSESTSGTAIELVNTADHSVIASRILDYYEVYDVKFVNNNEACFAGRPFGNAGYDVRFFSLPNLILSAQVMTAGLTGQPGFLAVDSTGAFVYYSHADGNHDGIYRIRVCKDSMLVV